jgi:hypothetical protein
MHFYGRIKTPIHSEFQIEVGFAYFAKFTRVSIKPSYNQLLINTFYHIIIKWLYKYWPDHGRSSKKHDPEQAELA